VSVWQARETGRRPRRGSAVVATEATAWPGPCQCLGGAGASASVPWRDWQDGRPPEAVAGKSWQTLVLRSQHPSRPGSRSAELDASALPDKTPLDLHREVPSGVTGRPAEREPGRRGMLAPPAPGSATTCPRPPRAGRPSARSSPRDGRGRPAPPRHWTRTWQCVASVADTSEPRRGRASCLPGLPTGHILQGQERRARLVPWRPRGTANVRSPLPVPPRPRAAVSAVRASTPRVHAAERGGSLSLSGR